jgi:integrase
MPTLKSNALAIKSALAKSKGTHTLEGHPGLYLQTRGDGNGSWVLRYRVNGKQREHTLHNDARNADIAAILNAKDAWRTAAKVESRDFKAEREAVTEAKRIADAADAMTYDKAYATWLDRPREKPLRPRSREEYERVHKLHIQPTFGDVPIAELAKQTIRDHFEATAKAAQKRGAKSGNGERGLQSVKALKQMSAVLSWCVDRDLLDKNPTRGIEPPAPLSNPKGKQARPPTNDELRAIWTNADRGLSEQHARMLRLAFLLGRRASEIAGAAQAELDVTGDNPHWLIPPRTGNKSEIAAYVPLPPLALGLVRDAIKAAGASPWLFPARGKLNTPAMRHGVSQAFTDFRRDIGIADQVRLHDVRGLIVDQMLKMQVPPQIISHVLHHTGDMKSALAMSVYRTYEFADEKLKALTLWEQRLAEIIADKPASGLRWQG